MPYKSKTGASALMTACSIVNNNKIEAINK
jgi:hypothetical protein